MVLTKSFLMALLFSGLLAGATNAAAVCDVMWANSSTKQQEDLHTALEMQSMLEQDGEAYPLRNIAEAIRQHASQNCPAFSRLTEARQSEKGYMAYLLGHNPGLMPAATDGGVEYNSTIPKQQFMGLIAGPGIKLGLTGGSQKPAAATAAARTTEPPAPTLRQSTIPGCPSCLTGSSD